MTKVQGDFREYANVPNIRDTLIRIRNTDKITEPTYTVSYGFPGDKAIDTVITFDICVTMHH